MVADEQYHSDRVVRAASAFFLDEYNDEFVVAGQVVRLPRNHQQSLLNYAVILVVLIAVWLLYRLTKLPSKPPVCEIATQTSPINQEFDNHTKTESAKEPADDSTKVKLLPGSTALAKQDKGNVPDLIQDSKPMNAMVQYAETTMSAAVVPKFYETTIDHARIAVRNVTLFEQASVEAGRKAGAGEAIQFAITQQTIQETLNANLSSEFRNYLFETTQRDIDRTIGERHHKEVLRDANTDKQWLEKIRSAHHGCMSVIFQTVLRCLVVCMFLDMLLPLCRVFTVWSQSTYTEIACSWTGSQYDPFGNYEASYFGTFFGFNTSYLSAPCLSHNAYRLGILAMWGALLAMTELFYRICMVPSTLLSMMRLGVILLAMWVHDLFPVVRLVCLLNITVVLAAITTAFLLEYKFRQTRLQFVAQSSPSYQDVNKAVLFFDECSFCIHTVQTTLVLGSLCNFAFYWYF